jgi:two-component system response regulator VicR
MSDIDETSADRTVPTILVVDDNRAVLDFLLLLLSKNALTAIGASSGSECLQIVRSQPVDLIILDVMMPVMDGLEVCRELKKMASTIPVILLTARDDMTTRAAAMDLGVSEFIAKPVNNRDLLGRVRTQLSNLEWDKAADEVVSQIERTSKEPADKA